MDKMKMETPNLTAGNIEKIEALFPSCITESKDANGQLKKAVNFELLRQLLSEDVVEGNEAYEFTWVGKKAAIVEANRPIRKTLRPCPEESVDWDTTENLYIEGDNLEVLKLLQESYLGKVKMIYIDPPYNTGHDFVYPDSFVMNNKDYKEGIGYFDEEGNVNFSRENNENEAKYHSLWCSMIYSRLLLARNLLSASGVIFISIDDHEVSQLRKICDEIFGAKNFIADFIWNSTKSVTNTAIVSVSHTYNLVFAKDIEYFVTHRDEFRLPEDGEGFSNPDEDPRGPWKADPFQVGGWRPNQQYEIINPNTKKKYLPNVGCSWKNDFSKFQELLKDNRIVFGVNGNAGPQRKRFLSEALDRGKVAKTLWSDIETTTNGTQLLKSLLGGTYFDNPKPVSLLRRMLELTCNFDDIVLDFFSGSATTAHAVMQLNAERMINGTSENVNLENGGGEQTKKSGIKYIMVQLPEPCDKKSEAYKAGYKNICEIGKERIHQAGKKIKEENPLLTDDLDIGFRVLKLDDTNMNDVYYAPGDYTRELLEQSEDNIKDDRTDLDLLFGCLLDWGATLSDPYESIQIEGCTVHNYNNGDLVACFDKDVPESVIKEIAKMKPERAVFRESCFKDSAAKINVEQIFKMLAPDMDVDRDLKII